MMKRAVRIKVLECNDKEISFEAKFTVYFYTLYYALYVVGIFYKGKLSLD